MRNDEKIIACLREIRENMGSNLFDIDNETQEDMIKCGAREYYVEDLEKALDDAIKWMEWDFKLRSEESND